MGYYDDIAPGYDELHGEEQKRKVIMILDNLQIDRNDSLLDVGCGTAQATSLFPCKKIGIDPSADLLKKASIPVIHGFAESLPFADNSFDIVVSLTAVHNFSDIHRALSEMSRVARRDIVITVLRKSPRHNEIVDLIGSFFVVSKKLSDVHDSILLCRKRFK